MLQLSPDLKQVSCLHDLGTALLSSSFSRINIIVTIFTDVLRNKSRSLAECILLTPLRSRILVSVIPCGIRSGQIEVGEVGFLPFSLPLGTRFSPVFPVTRDQGFSCFPSHSRICFLPFSLSFGTRFFPVFPVTREQVFSRFPCHSGKFSPVFPVIRDQVLSRFPCHSRAGFLPFSLPLRTRFSPVFPAIRNQVFSSFPFPSVPGFLPFFLPLRTKFSPVFPATRGSFLQFSLSFGTKFFPVSLSFESRFSPVFPATRNQVFKRFPFPSVAGFLPFFLPLGGGFHPFFLLLGGGFSRFSPDTDFIPTLSLLPLHPFSPIIMCSCDCQQVHPSP